MAKARRKSGPQGRPQLLALLQTCKQQPEDDTPRLVLADWLEEYGDEADRHWAELIRLQLGPASMESARRVGALCREWGERWLGGIAVAAEKWQKPGGWFPLTSLLTLPDEGKRTGGWYAWRGLFTVRYSGTKGDAQALARTTEGESCARVAHLCLDRVRTPALEVLADVPALKDLTFLTIAPETSDDATAELLARSPNFARLGALCLNSPDLTDRGLTALADAAHLAAIISLSLIKVSVTTRGMQTLAGAAFAPSLRYLRLRSGQCDLGDCRETLAALGSLPALEKLELSVPSLNTAALADAPGFAALQELNLTEGVPAHRFGDAGLLALLRTRGLPQLRVLNISSTGLSDVGLRALAQSDLLRRLTSLNLRDNPDITLAGLRDLVSSPGVAVLEDLDLSGNRLRDAGLDVLAQSGAFQRLRSLRLHYNQISDAGIKSLVCARWLPGVERLWLEVNDFGDAGVRMLADCPALAGCRELILWGNRQRISDAGAAALAGSPHLRNLRRLNLRDNRIGDEGVRALLASPHLAGLTELKLTTEHLGAAVVEELNRRFGGA
jgi:uncharacterized protein (TIGR02996 family)